MKRLLIVAFSIAAVLGLSVPRASAAEVIFEETQFQVGAPFCFDEAIVGTGTVRIVQNEVASVVTFANFTTVGVDTGDRYRVSFGFSATFPPQEFIVSTVDRLVIVDPDGNKLVSRTITHFSFVNGGPLIDIEIQSSKCIGSTV